MIHGGLLTVFLGGLSCGEIYSDVRCCVCFRELVSHTAKVGGFVSSVFPLYEPTPRYPYKDLSAIQPTLHISAKTSLGPHNVQAFVARLSPATNMDVRVYPLPGSLVPTPWYKHKIGYY